MIKNVLFFMWKCIWCIPCWMFVILYNGSKWVWGYCYSVFYGIAELDINKFKEAVNHIKGDEND